VIAYFDTSALIKVILTEQESQVASRAWEAADTRLTSRVTYPEARAALAAAQRVGRLTRSGLARAKRTLEERVTETDVVELGGDVSRLAGDVAERFAVRGFDAIHLASALVLEADEAVFVTWDDAQAAAAREAGLRTLSGG
jgi:predicted nucleic acid-binding protein